ncbi:MAG TPA: four helix bundle suffix domain-containing protein [Candidatus Hydrogenedentes bacterium]|jgi:four helix bundle suffix protein|nr:MAG: hypothetical protein BWX80_02994 [Candidatus Hydrogenedentes bacterium ADurb.Bin101]HQN01806.1 four helix bundle suffix domain-containing protein [Candidatus Hydrogenedentota bacterium]
MKEKPQRHGEGASLFPKYGGYKNLLTFKLAELIYDVTVRFCNRNISIRSRTHDQMVQSARSGVQNIVEGSLDSGTSKKMELKLTKVAHGSLGELKRDYQDFLRQRELTEWAADDPRRQVLVDRRCQTADEVAAWVKETYWHSKKNGLDGQNGQDKHDGPDKSSMKSIPAIPSIYSETAANAALVLIGVAMALLVRQLEAQGEAFIEEGGFTERLYRVRKKRREQS